MKTTPQKYAQVKAWQAANPERVRASKAKYRTRNRERLRDKSTEYATSNRDKVRAAKRAWNASHKQELAALGHARRVRIRGGIGSHTASEWEAIKTRQCGRCAICQERRPLTRDHIVPISKGGPDYAFNLQGLCLSCNSKKHAKLSPGTQHTLFDKVA